MTATAPTVRTAATPRLEELRAGDAAVVGAKAAHLGELAAAGFAVPTGFVVPASAYRDALDAAGVRALVADSHRRALLLGDEERERACADLAERVRAAGMPEGLPDAIRAAYAGLADAADPRPEPVAVRSSALGEDAEDTSFAGMHETVTGVRGADEVVARVVECWASLFAPRAVAYRAAHGIDAEPAIAVVVQRMVDADRAGVAFTADPRTGDRTTVVVEAALGQGEVVVGGAVEPDTYELAVDGPTAPRLRSVRVGHQAHEVVTGPDGRPVTVTLGAERAAAQVLTSGEIDQVARAALAVDAHYGRPQDVEWAFADGRLWLLQARPVTTGRPGPDQEHRGEVLLRGIAAAPGAAAGRVRILARPEDGAALRAGEVLVAPLTNPDWLPTMRRAAAVVTDSGGATCHAAIAARELGVPCVVGTGSATRTLAEGAPVTVDGTAGEVRDGDVLPGDVLPGAARPARASVTSPPGAAAGPVVVGTRVLVNLALPEAAARVAARGDVDGVGLLRAEFLLTSALGGRHPRALIAEGLEEEFVTALARSVEAIAAPFAPRPVVYRTSDLRSNEFRGLRGGAEHEPVESNPMIGYRGAFRALREPDVFGLELRALARVRERHPNLAVMLPFVRTRWELDACLELIAASPLGRAREGRGAPVWLMAEVPSVVYRLDEYLGAGVDGVSIGTNDLTQLVLGVDRDSELCAAVYDETDAAVLDAVERIVATGRRHGVPVSLCGQAPSTRPDFVDVLVRAGISSVSVDPSAVDAVRLALARAEQRLLLDTALATRPVAGGFS